LADNGEKSPLRTLHARHQETHLEQAINVPNDIGDLWVYDESDVKKIILPNGIGSPFKLAKK
jgi:hypothetical protein